MLRTWSDLFRQYCRVYSYIISRKYAIDMVPSVCVWLASNIATSIQEIAAWLVDWFMITPTIHVQVSFLQLFVECLNGDVVECSKVHARFPSRFDAVQLQWSVHCIIGAAILNGTIGWKCQGELKFWLHKNCKRFSGNTRSACLFHRMRCGL